MKGGTATQADVHYDVVKEFCDEVTADALGQEVLESLGRASRWSRSSIGDSSI